MRLLDVEVSLVYTYAFTDGCRVIRQPDGNLFARREVALTDCDEGAAIAAMRDLVRFQFQTNESLMTDELLLPEGDDPALAPRYGADTHERDTD